MLPGQIIASFISSPKTCSPSAPSNCAERTTRLRLFLRKNASRGVITYSSGNHGQGVAYAARALGAKAVIVMPNNAPAIKRDAAASLGAEIVLVGPGSLERQTKAEELAAQHGYVIVPPFNDEKIIAGQGTMGLEILEDLPEVETVLVPVGGGGMISGVATAIKLSKPSAKVIGIEPELAADAQASLRAGKIVESTAAANIAHHRRWIANAKHRRDQLRTHPAVRRRHFDGQRIRNSASHAVAGDESQDRGRTQRSRGRGGILISSGPVAKNYHECGNHQRRKY